MLIAFQGTVTQVRQLTATGFAEATIQDQDGTTRKAIGNDLVIMRKGESVILIGKEDVSQKYGPQTKILRWWFAEKCPFRDVQAARASIAFLVEELKLTPALSQRIFDAYLHETEAVLRDNPYRLVTEGRVKRIGVQTIDEKIAPYFKIDPSDRRRLKAQIIYTIKQARSLYGLQPFEDDTTGETYGFPGGGHVYCDFSQIVGLSAESMDLPRKQVAEELRRMAVEPRNPLVRKPLIVIEKDANDKDRYVYAHSLHAAEVGLAFHLRRLLDTGVEDLSHLQVVTPGLVLSDEQNTAIQMALARPISIITGGPGVGKTTIIKALTSTFLHAQVDFSLCAPTGVAARRMVKATDQPASTIHKLLAIDPMRGAFQHNRDNPLGSKAIICDESSMIDIGLMYSLFDAIASGARVILVGDSDQLPPVGPGAPFRDMVAWGQIPTTRLTEVRRQELTNSLIIKGSRSILAREIPEFSADPPHGDLYAFPYSSEMRALTMVTDLVLTKITATFGIERDGIQVLCPHRRMKRKKSKSGDTEDEQISRLLAAENINAILQEKIHGQKPTKDVRFFKGDRVIHTKNNYNLRGSDGSDGVMNGEIGYVREVREKRHGEIVKPEYVIEFTDGKKVTYEEKDSRELDLAYALSVHKSQGSEFQATVVLAYHSGNFFSRNMLYTAITRGKRVVIVVSPKGSVDFRKILKTDETKRASRLIWRAEGADIDQDRLEHLDLDDLSDGEDA